MGQQVSPGPQTLDQETQKLQSKHIQISSCQFSCPFLFFLPFSCLPTCLPFLHIPSLPSSNFLSTPTFSVNGIPPFLPQAVAHTPTSRSVTSVLFPWLVPSLRTTIPKGCPLCAVLTNLLLFSPKPSDCPLNHRAGWEIMLLFCCKVFHWCKST